MTTTAQKGEKAIYWIEELLSGTYKQTTGYLGNTNKGFCCLGVCNYVNGLGESDSEELVTTYDEVGLYGSSGDSYTLPYLANANDDYGLTLVEIGRLLRDFPHYYFEPDVADYIEEHFEDEDG